MTSLLAVIDTNVVVSGLITADSSAPTRAVVDRMFAGRVRFVLSEELLLEYREVLLRPAIRAAHGLAIEEIDELLIRLVEEAVITPRLDGVERVSPRDDEHLHRLLELFPDAVLVTGDRATRDLAGARGLTPREFVEQAPSP